MAFANIDVLPSPHRHLPNVLCNDIGWNWQGRCGFLGGIHAVIVLLLLFHPLRGLVVGATDIDVSIFVSSALGGLRFHSRNCLVFYCRYIESPALEK